MRREILIFYLHTHSSVFYQYGIFLDSSLFPKNLVNHILYILIYLNEIGI